MKLTVPRYQQTFVTNVMRDFTSSYHACAVGTQDNILWVQQPPKPVWCITGKFTMGCTNSQSFVTHEQGSHLDCSCEAVYRLSLHIVRCKIPGSMFQLDLAHCVTILPSAFSCNHKVSDISKPSNLWSYQ
jgi:hypothetical protein